jgi:hypothetical protein
LVLLRYFTFVGGALLALLIVVSSYFPETETITHREVARPVIRIASDKVGPPRVDIDTRVQTGVVPTSVPDVPQQAPARVAEAQLSSAHRSRHLLRRLSKLSARRRGLLSGPTAREWLPIHKDSSLSI